MKPFLPIILFTFLSSGLNAQWVQSNGPTGGHTDHLRKVSGHLFVSGYAGGVFRSSDGGMTWTAVNDHLPPTPLCNYLASYENNLYAAITTKGIYWSDDLGGTWNHLTNAIGDVTFQALLVRGQEIFAASGYGFYSSADHGNTWSLHQGSLKNLRIRDFVLSGDKLYAGVFGSDGHNGVYLSEDKGLTWKKLDVVIKELDGIGGYDNALYVSDGSLHISRDYGLTWESMLMGSGINYSMRGIYALEDDVAIAGSGKAIFYSNDEGRTWTSKLNSAPDNQHTSILSEGNDFWLATWSGVLYSPDKGDTWRDISTGLRNQIIDHLYVDGDSLMAVASSLGLYTSFDKGFSWSQTTLGTRDWGMNVVTGFHVTADYKLASTFSGLYRTNSLLNDWIRITLPEGDKLASLLTGDDDRAVAVVQGEGVYTSRNAGHDWTFNAVQLFDGKNMRTSSVKGDTIIVAGTEGIFTSHDYGGNWQQGSVSAGYFLPNEVHLDGPEWFILANQGVLRSVDKGLHWSRIDDLPVGIYPTDMAIDQNGAYHIGTNSGVYMSYNKGVNWFPGNAGLKCPVGSLAFQNEWL